jgi:hypothetical protein
MGSRLFARLILAAGLISLAALLNPNANKPALAQGVSVSVEFRQALEPHGRWHRHTRWGEVWIPRGVDREWRPYTRGHWVYTEDWGWYWDSEEEWGWVAYHYGRWVYDREVGWVWIPGDQWGPAWVSWRRGGEEVGWAPLPPDDIIVEIEDDPDVWIFVRARDVIAPNIIQVIVPRQRAVVLVRETVVVNRTVFVANARVAANVGVPPSYIAFAARQPVRVATVQPVVLRGTAGVRGAIEVDAQSTQQQRRRAVVKQAERSIQPAKDVPKPERLRPGETRQDTPDAPNVLRQAQPQQQQQPAPDTQQKQDAPTTQQKKDDDAPKTNQKAAPKADQKKDDLPKADQKKDAAPKTAPKQDLKQKDRDAPKGDTKDRPKMDQPKSEQKALPEQKTQQKRDLPDKSEQPKRDTPKGDMPRGEGPKGAVPKGEGPKRDVQPKGDAPKGDTPRGDTPRGDAPKGPQRQEGPAQQGPGPMRKDN